MTNLEQAKLALLEGKWHPLTVVTLEQLTEHAWSGQGSFSMRLLAGEVWRLRKENRLLAEQVAGLLPTPSPIGVITVTGPEAGWPYK